MLIKKTVNLKSFRKLFKITLKKKKKRNRVGFYTELLFNIHF